MPLTTPRRDKSSVNRGRGSCAACTTEPTHVPTAVTNPSVDWPFRNVPDEEIREDCARPAEVTTDDPPEPLVVGQITEDSTVPLVKVVIQHRLLSVEVDALVDTGASVSVINPDIWRLLGSPPLVQPKYGLISASNTRMPTKGLTKFEVYVGTCRTHASLWVMKGAVSPCILGYNMLRKLGAVVNCTRACLQFGSGEQVPFVRQDCWTDDTGSVAHLHQADRDADAMETVSDCADPEREVPGSVPDNDSRLGENAYSLLR
ncbi:hypothetical protein DYB32_010501 [Aphanomyces invadans]|uniref:Peptidase A2 domain-containing protein n=1 Tax=Aphanomyces invadans TaxID=157072 RepID=A0A3R6ZGZ0_9STRA|nr:hypothetical protein DYB32_010501 [Aphanomyces invadans]